LRDQCAEAFRFSSPLVSALRNPVDGRREEFLCVARFLFRCTQLFDLDAQHVYFESNSFSSRRITGTGSGASQG
jgi:hypothetical protein